jgi:hypothetical protein
VRSKVFSIQLVEMLKIRFFFSHSTFTWSYIIFSGDRLMTIILLTSKKQVKVI